MYVSFSFLDAWYKFRQLRCSDFFFFSTNLMKSTHFFFSPPNMNCSHFCTQIHQILSTIKMLHFRNSCILKITFVLKVLPVVIVGMSIAIVAISYCWCHCYHSYVHYITCFLRSFHSFQPKISREGSISFTVQLSYWRQKCE